MTGIFFIATAQEPDPERFKEEIDEILTGYNTRPTDPIVFAGSSSFRFWEKVSDLPSQQPILNHGFGGSHMSDLLFYLEELVLDFKPTKIFIYEGDNDIASDKSTAEIMEDTRNVVNQIKERLPDTEVYLLAAKPSISRWDYKVEYERLNTAYKEYAESNENLSFVDVWSPMLDNNGVVLQDIFVEDDLHMNEKGYGIWTGIIGPLVK